jgi:hypothetical protein
MLLGVALDILTFLVARYGFQNDNWSLRGNGSLVVPFFLGPAVVIWGAARLVRRTRGTASRIAAGVLFAVVLGMSFIVASRVLPPGS